MFDIGFSELVLTSIIALLVLGPERLPKAARAAGLVIGKIKRSFSNIQEELERQVRTDELREKLKDPYATFLDDEINLDGDNSKTAEQKSSATHTAAPNSGQTTTTASDSGAPKS